MDNTRFTQDDQGVWWYVGAKNRQRAVLSACATCSREFPNYPSRSATFCSVECRRYTCKRCGKLFASGGNRAAYCSYECQRGTATCEECGKVFVPTKKSAGRFCSTQCAYDNKVPVGTSRPGGSGYRIIKVPRGTEGGKLAGHRKSHWMWEHRYVMQTVLSRPLSTKENVHHINGDRADNRPENLELWNQSQPSGIRGSDYHCPGCRCAVLAM